jgi:hypothetical protein
MQAQILLDYVKEALSTTPSYPGNHIGIRVSPEAFGVLDEIGLEKAGDCRLLNSQYIQIGNQLTGYDIDVTETSTIVVGSLVQST